MENFFFNRIAKTIGFHTSNMICIEIDSDDTISFYGYTDPIFFKSVETKTLQLFYLF